MRKYSGSIISFVMVGLVFVFAAGLVVFAINNRSESGREISTIENKNTSDSESSSNKSKDNDKSNKAESSDSSNSETDKSSSDETEKTSKAADDGIKSETQSSTTPTTSVNTQSLPQTGMSSDMLSSVIGMISIVGAGYVYYIYGRK